MIKDAAVQKKCIRIVLILRWLCIERWLCIGIGYIDKRL